MLNSNVSLFSPSSQPSSLSSSELKLKLQLRLKFDKSTIATAESNQVKLAARESVAKVQATLSKSADKIEPADSGSPLDGIRLIASFFTNFLTYQVDTWRQLARESNACEVQSESDDLATNQDDICDATNETITMMGLSRLNRDVDGFVSKCTIKDGQQQQSREYYNQQRCTDKLNQPASRQSSNNSANDQQTTSQLATATAKLSLTRESQQNPSNVDSHQHADYAQTLRSFGHRMQTRATRLNGRSATIDEGNLPGSHLQDNHHQLHLVRRQVSEQDRQHTTAFSSAISPSSRRLHDESPFSPYSYSLASSRQTIDQQNSLSTSMEYSVDEPISLPATVPIATSASSRARHPALVRAITQSAAVGARPSQYAQVIGATPEIFHLSGAGNVFAMNRPNSSVEQRSALTHKGYEQQRQRRQISVGEELISPQRVAQRSGYSNIATIALGSDSELYNHPKSILQTSNRAYYIHHRAPNHHHNHHHNHHDHHQHHDQIPATPSLADWSGTGASSAASRASSARTTTSGGGSGGGVRGVGGSESASISIKTAHLSSGASVTTATANTIGTNAPASQKRSAISKTLSLAGAKRRLGFKQSGLSALSVQRSEEVLPLETSCSHLIRHTTTAQSLSDSGTESSSCWFSQSQSQQQQQQQLRYPIQLPADPRCCFVEGLGAGQIASRQALVSPYLGDIQLALNDRRGMLEVDVIRARSLQIKAGAKTLPSPYVKVYLMRGKKCMAKCKTSYARKTLDPLYQQKFIFREDYINCVLQVIVWGNYGKKDRKSLMGIVQIHLDDLDISDLVIGWYKLFNVPSMTNSSLISSKSLRHSIVTKNLSLSSTSTSNQQEQQQHTQQSQIQSSSLNETGYLNTDAMCVRSKSRNDHSSG